MTDRADAEAGLRAAKNELRGRMRAARPMTRAEIGRGRTLAPAPRVPTTFDEGTGALESDDDADLVPVRGPTSP